MQIKLSNLSPTEEDGTYVLSLVTPSDLNGLRVFIDGAPLAQPITFSGFPYGQRTVLVEVYRGPTEYSYAPLTLSWDSTCDGAVSAQATIQANYIEPCPAVAFGADLAQEQKLTINYNTM